MKMRIQNPLKRGNRIEKQFGISMADITFIEPDYVGISQVLEQFVELYKVVENKKMLDNQLELFLASKIIDSGSNQ